MDRIDEAVSVAGEILADHALDGDGPNEKALRLAFLAGMKALLGEPVAWAVMRDDRYLGCVRKHRESAQEELTYHGERYAVTPLYAPSLGEGDGR